jgi:hypothetical protein
MPFPPLKPPWKVTPHGAFNLDPDYRTDPKLCPQGKAPCRHPGVDLACKPGREIVAPEAGRIVYAVQGNRIKPFSYFGPALLVLHGATTGASHLLAHLGTPLLFEPWQEYDNGLLHYLDDEEALMEEPGKATKIPPFGTKYDVDVLDVIGYGGPKNHLHWEIRRAPTDRDSVSDPMDWLDRYAQSITPGGVPGSAAITQATDGGGDILWLLLAMLGLGTRRRKK